MRAVQLESWRTLVRVFLAAVLAGAVSACDPAQVDASAVSGGTSARVPDPAGPPDEPAGSTTTMIGPAGGTAMSPDGRLTLAFPAGAVGSMTPITIGIVGAEALSAEFDGITPDIVYELGPDGTAFPEPVTVTLRPTDQPVVSGTGVSLNLPLLASDSSAGAEALANQTTSITDGGTLLATGELTHFSRVFAIASIVSGGESRPIATAAIDNLPDDIREDEVFTFVASATAGVLRFDSALEPILEYSTENLRVRGEFLGLTAVTEAQAGLEHEAVSQEQACLRPGEFYAIQSSMVLNFDGPVAELSPGIRSFLQRALGQSGFDATVLVEFPVHIRDCLDTGTTPVDPTPDGAIFRGFQNLAAELSNTLLDAFTSFGFGAPPSSTKGTRKARKPDVASFADFGTGPFGLFSSGDGAVGGINLLDGSVVFNADLSASGFTPFGVAAMTSPPGGPETRAAIVAYGNAGAGNAVAGSLRVYRAQPSPPGFPTSFAFSNAANIEAEFVLDATNTGGGVLSAAIVLAGSEGVTFIRPDQNAGFFHDTRGLDIGPVFSAFRLEDTSVGGSTMVLQDSADLGPLIRRAQSNVFSNELANIETVGATGPNPRKLRCIPDFCAASHNGEADVAASGITWFAWDGFGSVDFPDGGTADFGTASPIAGTIGIDVRELPNGNYGVVGTGFNNNMVYEVEVNASDLSFVRQVETPAPTGCENPGHAQWFEDARGLGYLLSCFGGGYAADDAHIGVD